MPLSAHVHGLFAAPDDGAPGDRVDAVRRAKIVCTLGPSTSSNQRIQELVDAGMDVARLNLSHGTYEEHERIYRRVRAASDATGHGVGIFVDLQGPKIRLGRFRDGSVEVEPGDPFVITTRKVEGDKNICSTTYAGLPGDVSAGDDILIDDGNVRMGVVKVDVEDVHCVVEVGGRLSNNKGINLPGVAVSVPAMSDKDVADLRWALRMRTDMVALSFVRSAADVDDVRRVMREEGKFVPVIAKIEKPQALDHLGEIINAFDGFMVARGDLGVEMPLEDVPMAQKRIVEAARRHAKPVIVATQMLESMISNPRPTRAEASDVANAVLDGADAVMLSGETSIGDYPIQTVQTMWRIIAATEEQGLERMAAIHWEPHTKGGIIAKAAAEVAERVGARFLVAFTASGDSARRLARYRSEVPLLAFTPDAAVRSQLALTWGVETFLVPRVEHTDEMVMQLDRGLLASGHCGDGDLVVIVAGSPPGIPGSTNALRIHRMGDAIKGVAPAYRSEL
jgi:pyruvate kinase